MDSEVKIGIEKFQRACEQTLPGIQLVVPVRPTGANFLISLTHQGIRTYVTIHEDQFAEWGEMSDELPGSTLDHARECIAKLVSPN